MTTVVMYEDRPSALVGVRLALLSLTRHSPGLPVVAWLPTAPPEFTSWARSLPDVDVREHRDGLSGQGWNVKPSVLLRALDEGHDQVVWFDTDMMVTGDLAGRLAAVPASTLVATEEYHWGHHQGSSVRTTGLGLPVGRVFPATLNTCLLRVHRHHHGLVEEWYRVLASDEYVAAQSLSGRHRPLHFWSDLDVLTGLLGAREHAGVPVVQLRRGVDIAQCYGPSGFTLAERLACGRRLPLLLHAMGNKPWGADRPQGRSVRARLQTSLDRVHQELTPYALAAREYAGDVDTSWAEPTTLTGRVLASTFPRRPALRESPLTVLDSAQRGLRRRLGVGQIASAS